MEEKNQPQKEEIKKEKNKQIPPTPQQPPVTPPGVPGTPVIPQQPKMRQVIIETDGNIVKVVKAEVSGNLEFSAVLSAILKSLR